MIAPAPIRVVVVEDSPTQRSFLCRCLQADGDIVVVGEAASAMNAVAVTRSTEPDVVTMDLEIPGGGLYAIARIMEETPRPILLLSGQLDSPRAPQSISALGAGAVGVLVKPRRWDDENQTLLRTRVRTLSRVRPEHKALPMPSAPPPGVVRANTIIGIGASTGGPAALARVLSDLGSIDAPILCVQHIDGRHVDGLARWLASTSGCDVRVAQHGETPMAGVVYLGPGGVHLTLDPNRRIALVDDAPTLHTPSVDRLLLSLAEVCGANAVGCVLTGMGSDGALGMAALAAAGAYTMVQDEASSVVYGMAGAAVERGGVKRVLPLEALGTAIVRATRVAG